MRRTSALVLAVLASGSFASSAAMAGEAIYLTPPLFREQARETQQVRSTSDLTTTPQPIAAAKPDVALPTIQVEQDVKTTGSL